MVRLGHAWVIKARRTIDVVPFHARISNKTMLAKYASRARKHAIPSHNLIATNPTHSPCYVSNRPDITPSWPHFYQTRSAWSVDQGSNENHSPAYNFAPTVTKFCVMWEGLSLPHDTKFGNCRCKIVDSRAFPSWSLIHGLRRSGLIKAEPASY